MQQVYDILVSRLEALRKQGDSPSLYDINSILKEISTYLDVGQSEFSTLLQSEILKIADHIEATKKEIVALTPGQQTNQSISQLEAVIKSTEDAASTIMDAADEIQEVIAASNASAQTKDKITEIATRLYEACNFQDLINQRVIKVMRELEFIEAKILHLSKLFASEEAVPATEALAKKEMRADEHLMNGPQLPGDAPSQADIDMLFKKA